MLPHPDFASLNVPSELDLGPFKLEMLTAEDLEADYSAVVGSASVLRGVFGDTWPEGLTRHDDEIDLHWHHREFTARRSFAWVIRDGTGAYIGCAYLAPDIGATGTGHAVFWIVDHPDRQQMTRAFRSLYQSWLAQLLPDGYTLRYTDNAHLGQAA